MIAELVYLFRHALLRDAAYQLQAPADRARMHALAFEIIESILGRVPGLPDEHDWDSPHPPHAADPLAQELAQHANETAQWHADESWQLRAARCLNRAALHAGRQNRHDESARLWEQAAACSRLDALPRAAMLWSASTAAGRAGDSKSVDRLARAAHELAFGIPDPAGETARLSLWTLRAVVLMQVAAGGASLGRRSEQKNLLLQALELARAAKNRWRMADALKSLGIAAFGTGDLEDARRLLEESHSIAKDIGNTSLQIACEQQFGEHAARAGKVEQAESHYKAAIAMARQANHRSSEMAAVGQLAVLHTQSGRLEEALVGHRAAHRLAIELGNRRSIAATALNIGVVLQEQGRVGEAGELYESALESARELGSSNLQLMCMGNLATARRIQGDHHAAEQLFTGAIGIALSTGDLAGECLWRGNLGCLYLTREDLPRAEECLKHALELARRLGHPRHIGQWLGTLAQLEVLRGDLRLAGEYWRESARLLTDARDTTSYQSVLADLQDLRAKRGLPPIEQW